MRADRLLVDRRLAGTRAQAQRLIAAGVEFGGHGSGGVWARIGKNGEELRPDIGLRLIDDAEVRYVSRGGLKLEGALDQLGLSVQGSVCLDVGQSTGGFTDCLLVKGAARVVGVDVGHGQLSPRLACDARVVALEGINARHLDASKLIAAQQDLTVAGVAMDAQRGSTQRSAVATFDLIVADLSFISLTLVLPALAPLLAPDGALLLLVKPQFELERPGQLGKGGLVRDEQVYAAVEQRLRSACERCAFMPQHLRWIDSCVRGGDGNREFFIFASKPP